MSIKSLDEILEQYYEREMDSWFSLALMDIDRILGSLSQREWEKLYKEIKSNWPEAKLVMLASTTAECINKSLNHDELIARIAYVISKPESAKYFYSDLLTLRWNQLPNWLLPQVLNTIDRLKKKEDNDDFYLGIESSLNEIGQAHNNQFN